jgi:dipeptidase D
LSFAVRSSVNQEKRELLDKLKAIAQRYGADYSESGNYPAWEYRKDSPLRDLMVEVFRDQYGREPVVAGIHAGLECGIFSKKIEDADAVSFGPDIENIHTPKERLNIASAQRTWEFLKEILRRSK